MSPYFRNLLKSIGHDYMAPDARVYNTKQYLDGGRVGFGEGTRANQHSKKRTVKELQKIIDNAPQMPAGDKFLNMNAKDLTGESVNAIKYNRNPNYPGRKKV